jgi:hypothetical protein
MKNAYFIFVILMLTTQLLSANRNDYLMAYWDFETLFEGKVKNMSNNNHNLSRVGNIGKCIRFDGKSHLELDEDCFLADECNLTITSWFKI